ncbi:hypothetical protein STEG23_014028 [Scotinomys teguina]
MNKPHPAPLRLWWTGEHTRVHQNTPLSSESVRDPQQTLPAHHKVSIFNCKQPQSLLKTQEQPVTLGRRGPKSNQSPLEEEDPGAASHPRRTSHSHFLTLRSSQSPSEEEEPGAASHHRRKRTKEQPVTLRGRGLWSTQTPSEQETSPDPSSKAEMGRRQCKSTYNNIKNKTSPESSPPPTPRLEHCNVDKAEENDLKNSLMKMIEEALEGKMKNAIKEIEKKTNKKLEENNKEIEEKNKKIKEMNKEIEDKNKKMEEIYKEIEKTNKKLEEINKEIEEKTNKKLEEMNKEIEEKNKKLEEMSKEIEEKINRKLKEIKKNSRKRKTKKLEEMNKETEEKTNKK